MCYKQAGGWAVFADPACGPAEKGNEKKLKGASPRPNACFSY